MRILSLLLVLAACVKHPAPNGATIERAERQGYGGYVLVTLRDGSLVRGELLAVNRDALWVLDANGQQTVNLHNVTNAELFKYEYEGGTLGVWGTLGAISTLSHGFWLVFSFPIWLATAITVSAAESRHMRLRYPDDGIDSFRDWARYPQGMPGKPEPASKREQAWQLTKQAEEAARAGTCATVQWAGPRVQMLDAELHEQVFMRDEAIRRCLQLPSLLPAAGATP